MAQYKKYPMPVEAWKNFKLKQQKISDSYKSMTGKTKIIPLSKIILATSRKSLWFDNDEIISLGKKNGRRI